MTVVRSHTVASILIDPESSSVKRLAWAYGCSPKGSDVEAQLLELLVARIKRIP